jgi:hypothetical protein
VGGGFLGDPNDVTFYTQYPYGNGWRGDATNNAGFARQIFVFAVCLYNVPGASVTQVHGEVTVPPGQKGQAVATCPAGSIATGGGFYAYPDGSLQVYNSSKADSGEGWQSWAQNNSSSNRVHRAFAVCLSGTGGSTAQIMQSVDVPAGYTRDVFPACGSGSLVTSGGFAAQEDLIVYNSSGPYGNKWDVVVLNTHASEERLLYGYVVCLCLP